MGLLASDRQRIWREDELDVGVSAGEIAEEERDKLAREYARRTAREQGLPEVSAREWV